MQAMPAQRAEVHSLTEPSISVQNWPEICLGWDSNLDIYWMRFWEELIRGARFGVLSLTDCYRFMSSYIPDFDLHNLLYNKWVAGRFTGQSVNLDL